MVPFWLELLNICPAYSVWIVVTSWFGCALGLILLCVELASLLSELKIRVLSILSWAEDDHCLTIVISECKCPTGSNILASSLNLVTEWEA